MSCWIIKKNVILSKHKIISSYCSNYQLRPIVTLQCPVQMAIPISFGNIVTWPRCNIQWPNISVSWPVNMHAYNWISTIYYKTKCWCTSFFVYRVISRMNTISQQWSDSTSQRTYFLRSPQICLCYLQSFDNCHSLKLFENSKNKCRVTLLSLQVEKKDRKKDRKKGDSWNVLIL